MKSHYAHSSNSLSAHINVQCFIDVSAFTVKTPDVTFISPNHIKIQTSSGSVLAASGKRRRVREKERVKRPSALHRFIATGSCTAQEKCAYIITCGPGILQRALLIAETQSGGGNQPTQEELGKALPRN